MTINRSFLMFALPVGIAFCASTAQAEPAKANGVVKTESPKMATSIRDWHPELNGKTTAAQATPTKPDGTSANQPEIEMRESPATRGRPLPQPGKRSEPAQEIPTAPDTPSK